MDEDTVVFVFGDHGMTTSGDHGGETELETTAALIVFTPSPLFPPIQVYTRVLYTLKHVTLLASERKMYFNGFLCIELQYVNVPYA